MKKCMICGNENEVTGCYLSFTRTDKKGKFLDNGDVCAKCLGRSILLMHALLNGNEECEKFQHIDKNKFKVALNYLERCLIESDFLQFLSVMLGDKEKFDDIGKEINTEILN